MPAGTTLFALSTPRGRGAVAVVRVTGPDAGQALRALAGKLPPPRHARLAKLCDPTTGEMIDRGVILWFPEPASVTGENLAEFQVHGSTAVINALLESLGRLPGFHPAAPGDFTRRAFENGRMDLTAVEGLADLIDAETPAQRRQALRQLDGALAALVEEWRDRIVRLMALAEAEIDFPEEDLPEGLLEGSKAEIVSLRHAFDRQLAHGDRGERLRSGFQVALVGPPNVGKSTLLNALAKRDVAIVTDEPGTTRDILDVHLDLGGYPVTIADMAGLRSDAGHVEALGIARALRRAEEADLRLVLIEGGAFWTSPAYEGCIDLLRPGDIVVRSKCDLIVSLGIGTTPPGYPVIPVSSPSGEGLPSLLEAIQLKASSALGSGEQPALTRLRHRQALEEARTALDRLVDIWAEPPELRAEELRLVARALGRITGRIDVEDVLGQIFASFCIGK